MIMAEFILEWLQKMWTIFDNFRDWSTNLYVVPTHLINTFHWVNL